MLENMLILFTCTISYFISYDTFNCNIPLKLFYWYSTKLLSLFYLKYVMPLQLSECTSGIKPEKKQRKNFKAHLQTSDFHHVPSFPSFRNEYLTDLHFWVVIKTDTSPAQLMERKSILSFKRLKEELFKRSVI